MRDTDPRTLALLVRRATAGVLLAAVAFGAASCDDPTGPEQRQTDELTFLRAAPGAPPLVTTTVSFWAKRGEHREAEIYYRPRPGAVDSTRFLRFRVSDDALLRRPNGTTFASGDSILITITVPDPTRLMVDMQPSGLRFNPGEPAELELRFSESDDDLDGDGDVDTSDSDAKTRLSIWRQEAPGQPWFKVPTLLEASVDRVKGDITGFTGYAIAY